MKNLRKTSLLLAIIIACNAFCLNGNTGNPATNPKTASTVKLKQVFTSTITVGGKDILKLYDDNTYEFLFFQIKNKKPIVKRERGTYRWKNKKLILDMKGKKMIKEHPTRFVFIEEKGLFKSKRFHSAKTATPEYSVTTEQKFWEATYFDSIYGQITNDKKAYKKIIEIKKEQVPTPLVVIDTINSTNSSSTDTYITDSKVNLSKNNLQKIKAVIVVGADEFNGNKDFIEEQKKVAAFLKGLGVQVKEYYFPNSKWADIKKGSQGANIFIYGGHGITLGETDKQGTLYLNEGIIEGPELTNGLGLNKNALVLFSHACSSAGSSAADLADIGVKEATNRVEDYAKPFINLNAGCYYANNYFDYIQPFLVDFFNGNTVKNIYMKQVTASNKVEILKKHKSNASYEIGVSSNMPSKESYISVYSLNEKGKLTEKKIKASKSYDVAFVGLPNYTIKNLLSN